MTIAKKYKFDYWVHGDDWKRGVQAKERLKLIKEMKKWKGKVIDVPYTKGISSSVLKNLMQKSINCKRDIEKLLKNEKIKTILFISGKNSFYKTKANIFLIKFLKIKKFFYFKESKFPNFNELKNIIKEKEKIEPDLIIAVGGGCVLDYAKIASNFSLSSNLEKNYKFRLRKKNKSKIKIISDSTTAGSGAESTSNAVIYINNIKYSVEGSLIQPDYFYIEPKFLQSTSLITDASAGFDAISQAVESMFSLKSNNESLKYSSKALKLLLKNFESFIKKTAYKFL